ncbi:MAG: DNA polymerase III subunit alpha, partial [Gammaproteobacteria bacterium]|nr:DNA polymerase III subunit alpha [Gammaproteobacteria bacterium]
RSGEEMGELFADLPEALENTVEIARRCNLKLRLGENFLPAFPVPEGKSENEWFAEEARNGLERRLATLFDPAAPDFPERRKIYDERLRLELDVIISMGFPGYFLIVADFIGWARDNGVPVGPGRGSGAGSLVAYAQGITDLDPIEYELLFERFLNPERVSLPDFDVDFCMDGRDRVIDYVAEKYGRDRVSQIITYGSMAAKAVVRDVGRVLGHPYGFVDTIAKLIPFDLKMTLDKALGQEEVLRERYEQEEEVRSLIDLARKLEGLARNAGKHAGGVVIAPSVLTDFAPLYCEQGAASIVTQFDKDDVEAVGLVKFDFLGLRTLTIIDWAMGTVGRERKAQGLPTLDISRIPTDDQETFELVKRAATTAVFQLESRGMKDLIRRLQPDCFEDIIALVALFRPGPLQSGMVDDFIDCKHGLKSVVYPHPDLESVLKPTYGVILYQEQVMQIARVLANFTFGGADLLRRAMGKKKAEAMAKQREIFLRGAVERGVAEETASRIFDLMEKFAGYGFNKSHSAAYALVAYQTAWLKAHYPAAFMAAVLSADMDNTDKVVGFVDECREMGLTLLPPRVNSCDYSFTVDGEATIHYGLGAIKGVGQGAIEGLMAEREAGGPYSDLFEFCRRMDTRKLNRRALEAMIRAGALDELGPSRAAMMATLTRALQAAEQHSRNSAAGQIDLFGAVSGAAMPGGEQYVEAREWPEEQRLEGEKEILGLYLTGHPICRYETELSHFITGRLAELRPSGSQAAIVAGLVVAMRVLDSRRGRMAILTLDDRTTRMEATVFSDVYEHYRDMLARDRLLILEGEVAPDDRNGGFSITVKKLYDINDARAVFARRIAVRLDSSAATTEMGGRLAEVLDAYREGHTHVCIDYLRPDARVRLRLGDGWRVRPTDELIHRLGELAGEDRVKVEY